MSDARGQTQKNNARLKYDFPQGNFFSVLSGLLLADGFSLGLGQCERGEEGDDQSDDTSSVITNSPSLELILINMYMFNQIVIT